MTDHAALIARLREKADAARTVSNAMSQRGRWQMRVPVDAETDSDMVIHALADAAEEAASALTQAETERARLREALLSARPYVEAACGAKNFTAGMAEENLRRVNVALAGDEPVSQG